MAKGDFYFPLYYQRLLTSTIGWTDEELGCYLRLLIHQFDKGSIPSDMKEICRIAPSAKKHWKLLSTKFKDDGAGGLVNEVMLEVMEKKERIKERNQENGSKGGRKKRNETEIEPKKNPVGSVSVSKNEAIPISNNQYPNIERDTPPVIFSIEHCITIALADARWTKANKTNKEELEEFNAHLERQGVYEKNPFDYKTHFANWKRKGKIDITLSAPVATIQASTVSDNIKKLKELHGINESE